MYKSIYNRVQIMLSDSKRNKTRIAFIQRQQYKWSTDKRQFQKRDTQTKQYSTIWLHAGRVPKLSGIELDTTSA